MRKYWRWWGWAASAGAQVTLFVTSHAYASLPLWLHMMVGGCIWAPYLASHAYSWGYWKGYERNAREYMGTVFRIVGTELHERK